jgi:hypothetical protein
MAKQVTNEEVIKQIRQGIRRRIKIFAFGMICGIFVVLGFLLAGLALKEESFGRAMLVIGIIFSSFLVALVFLFIYEREQVRKVILAIRSDIPLAYIFYFLNRSKGTGGPEGYGAQSLPPFHFIFMKTTNGGKIRFSLPAQKAFHLFIELLQKYPKAQFAYPRLLQPVVMQAIKKHKMHFHSENLVSEKEMNKLIGFF